MTTQRYNLDERVLIRNKYEGTAFINNPEKKAIYKRAKNTGKLSKVADFCITDILWNDSTKDIDNITLNGASGSQEYVLQSNSAALKNRIFREACVPGGQVLPGSVDKKFMHFAVNDMLYEFIVLVVNSILNDSLDAGLAGVTLAITTADTETLKDAVVTITAKDEDNNAVQGLDVTGSIGDEEVSDTTNANGQVSVTLEEAGTYAVSVESAKTTSYKAAAVIGSIDVTVIESEEEETPGTE